MKKLGVIGIIIEKDREMAKTVQSILTDYGDIIIGRMGVPDKEEGVYVISIIVSATNEEISALSGKLGKLPNVTVKSAVTNVCKNN